MTPQELMSKIDQMALWSGNGYSNNILDVIKEFEQEIRKDQDKITRHACAESIDQELINNNHSGNFARQLCREAIINTKSI